MFTGQTSASISLSDTNSQNLTSQIFHSQLILIPSIASILYKLISLAASTIIYRLPVCILSGSWFLTICCRFVLMTLLWTSWFAFLGAVEMSSYDCKQLEAPTTCWIILIFHSKHISSYLFMVLICLFTILLFIILLLRWLLFQQSIFPLIYSPNDWTPLL